LQRWTDECFCTEDVFVTERLLTLGCVLIPINQFKHIEEPMYHYKPNLCDLSSGSTPPYPQLHHYPYRRYDKGFLVGNWQWWIDICICLHWEGCTLCIFWQRTCPH
jgi:hypothetical protein